MFGVCVAGRGYGFGSLIRQNPINETGGMASGENCLVIEPSIDYGAFKSGCDGVTNEWQPTAPRVYLTPQVLMRVGGAGRDRGVIAKAISEPIESSLRFPVVVDMKFEF